MINRVSHVRLLLRPEDPKAFVHALLIVQFSTVDQGSGAAPATLTAWNTVFPAGGVSSSSRRLTSDTQEITIALPSSDRSLPDARFVRVGLLGGQNNAVFGVEAAAGVPRLSDELVGVEVMDFKVFTDGKVGMCLKSRNPNPAYQSSSLLITALHVDPNLALTGRLMPSSVPSPLNDDHAMDGRAQPLLSGTPLCIDLLQPQHVHWVRFWSGEARGTSGVVSGYGLVLQVGRDPAVDEFGSGTVVRSGCEEEDGAEKEWSTVWRSSDARAPVRIGSAGWDRTDELYIENGETGRSIEVSRVLRQQLQARNPQRTVTDDDPALWFRYVRIWRLSEEDVGVKAHIANQQHQHSGYGWVEEDEDEDMGGASQHPFEGLTISYLELEVWCAQHTFVLPRPWPVLVSGQRSDSIAVSVSRPPRTHVVLWPVSMGVAFEPVAFWFYRNTTTVNFTMQVASWYVTTPTNSPFCLL